MGRGMPGSHKPETFVRVLDESREWLKQRARELSVIEGRDTPIKEVIRRMTRIPTIEPILHDDAEKKRFMK